MSLLLQLIQAGFAPPKPNPERAKRRQEEAGAFMRLELFRKARKSLKRDEKREALAKQRQHQLGSWCVLARQRAAENKLGAAQAELKAARQAAAPRAELG